MYHVYLMRSISFPEKKYVGYTIDLEKRLETHNSGGSKHTTKYRPWKLVMFFSFTDEKKAISFEKYLKSGSGRIFAKRRLW